MNKNYSNKCAYFPATVNPSNLDRFQKMASHFKYFHILNNSTDLFKIQPSSVLMCDGSDVRDKSIIIILIIFGKIKKIDFISLEVYSIDFRALFQERKVSLLELYCKSGKFYFVYRLMRASISFLYAAFSVFLTRTILNISNSTTFVSSNLRLDYLYTRTNISTNYSIMKNLPLKGRWKYGKCDNIHYLNTLIQKRRYLFLPGNIHNEEEFILVCEFARLSSLIIVIASYKKITNQKIKKYDNIIVETGPLSYECIVDISYHCVAGIALYRSNTINQTLSASSKFLEFLYIRKPVITSRNEGVLSEVKNYSAKVFFVDNLKHVKFNGDFSNSLVSFETYLDNAL